MSRIVNPQQLTLNLCLPDYATFENFYVGDNHNVVTMLHNVVGNSLVRFIYLWGEPGSGRTHLLSACCAYYRGQSGQQLPVAYIPFKDLQRQGEEASSTVLENLENMSLLCFDDIDVIAGDERWEEALFHCFNRLQERHNSIIVVANATPNALPLRLPDLRSRLASGVISEIKSLSDEQKIMALQFRAEQLGLTLPPVTANFLINHCARDTTSLFALLRKLDQASLRAQRGLTVPFIKQVLNNNY